MTSSVTHPAAVRPDDNPRSLPWRDGERPLILAPMQGLTNRAMRALFIEWVRPDVVFTEFMRVSNVSRKRLGRNDLTEAVSTCGNVPLVVQLVGNEGKALVAAASNAAEAGARHINLNMGCPYGRMTSGATGGAMLQHPKQLAELLPQLRAAITGTFSIKLRSGYDDAGQIFSLLPLFADSAVDFLVLHPRTVTQEYNGAADHDITRQVVREAAMPVIANGDIRTAADGLRILSETNAAGLMLGRGAIADPLLFERLRKQETGTPSRAATATMLQRYLQEVMARYATLFCGERQVLDKTKNVLAMLDYPDFSRQLGKMKRAKSLAAVADLVAGLEGPDE
jgi:tRNA-dihydrouridine synthase